MGQEEIKIRIQNKNPRKDAPTYTLTTIQDIADVVTADNIKGFLKDFEGCLLSNILMKSISDDLISKGEIPPDSKIKMPSIEWTDDWKRPRKTTKKTIAMNLKEQTVYIPITDSIEKGTITYIDHFSEIENFRVINVRYIQETLQEKQNQILLSKEELIELISKSYDGGFDESGEGYNGEYPSNVKNKDYYKEEKAKFINNILK